jgi:hypothetical protein
MNSKTMAVGHVGGIPKTEPTLSGLIQELGGSIERMDASATEIFDKLGCTNLEDEASGLRQSGLVSDLEHWTDRLRKVERLLREINAKL